VSAQARAKALEGVGWLADRHGDLDRAEAAAEEGLKLSAEAELGELVVAEFQNVLGDVARQRGNYERATRLVEESLALYQEAGDKPGIAWTLGNLANVAGDRGDHERAKQLYEEGIARSRQLGGAYPLGEYLVSPGYTLLLEGNPERTMELNEEAVDLLRKRRRRGGLQFALDNLGWAMLLQGEHDKAEALYKDSLILCKELGDRLVTSKNLEGLACTAGAKGDAERAARLFGAAEVLREDIGYLQAPRESTLREPYLEAAGSRLDEAAWEKAFTEGRAMGPMEAVEYALATEEEADPRITPTPEEASSAQLPVDLTRREREVASLVAQGLTNPQIASELVIGERTVETHVRNLLKKLGFSSREQVPVRMGQQPTPR
jgi:non-specific serine/threonine protein kinase